MKESFQAVNLHEALVLLALAKLRSLRPLPLRRWRDAGCLEQKLHQLAQQAGTAEYDWAEKELVLAEKHAVSVIAIGSDQYPKRLLLLDDPPLLIFVAGVLPPEEMTAAAIVGTRDATRGGAAMARELAAAVTAAGGTVVSGMARGIDGSAHAGAVEFAEIGSGHPGIAVLGAGLLQVTPVENLKLRDRLLAAGGSVVSEFGMSTHPTRFTFPQRNRIISGLSDGVIVIEAKERSGALITARCALEQGREVFVVPGSPYTPASAGSNRLLRDGATPLIDRSDIHSCFPRLRPEQPENHQTGRSRQGGGVDLVQANIKGPETGTILGTSEQSIIALLTKKHLLSFDELIEELKFPAPRLASLLGLLEADGVIYSHPGALYSVTPFVDI